MRILRKTTDSLKIEIELNPDSTRGSARVVLKPLFEHMKTLSCVIDAIKELLTTSGYSIDSITLHSDSSIIELVLYFSLKDLGRRVSEYRSSNKADAGGG